MGFFGKNLRLLRRQKAITQQQLADYLSIKRPVIGAYEEERAEPKIEMLHKMALFFGLSVDELTKEDVDTNLIASSSSGARILSITTGNDDIENIEVVPVRASAGYLNGYADPEFISSLPRFRLPMLSGGTFRAFELKGDSMLPLLPGTYVVGEYVDNWNLVKLGETYVVLTLTEGIVYKRVSKKTKTGFELQSDNSSYAPFSVHQTDVLEFWKAKAYISMQLPALQISANSI